MSKQDNVNQFFDCQDPDPQEVDFGEFTVKVRESSIGDVEEAEKLAGRGASESRQTIALMVCCTYDADDKERFFDKTHIERLCQARGELKARLTKIAKALNKANEVEGN